MNQKDMEALIVGSRRQINLDVLLPNNNRADIQVPSVGGELHFTLLRENNEIHRDDYYNGYTDTSGASQPTRLVRQSNGRYYYPFGLNGVEQTECGLYQAIWDYRVANQFDYQTEWQLIRVIPTSSLELIEDLRLILDKALKYYNDKVPTPTRIGYSTGMLVKYLELGLAGINAQPPYPTWASLEVFPKAYKSLLIKAALYWGVTSQLLYAIDTDITNYCFAKGTKVTMSDGTQKSIENIVIGEKVIDRNGKEQFVEDKWSEGIRATKTIKMWGGREINCTPNHNFPVWKWSRKCFCKCGEIVRPCKRYKKGHWSPNVDKGVFVSGQSEDSKIARYIPSDYNPIQKLRAEEIEVGDFLIIPREFEQVDSDLTEVEARILGYYIAEGNKLFNKKNVANNLQFTFSSKEEFTFVQDLIDKLNSIGVKTRKKKVNNAIYVFTNNELKNQNKGKKLRIVELVEKYIHGDYAAEKRLDELVLRFSLNLKKEIIKGWVRGDGHQSWQNSNGGNNFGVYLSTSSPYLASQYELIMAQLGFAVGHVTENITERIINGKIYKTNPLHKLKVSGNKSFEFADFVYEDLSKSKDEVRVNYPTDKWMIDDRYIYLPVKEIYDSLDQEVFNLTVSDDHSFLVYNISTFNSDNGLAYVKQHAPQLAGYLASIKDDLRNDLPKFKMQFVSIGSVVMRNTISYRWDTLIQNAPAGATLRGFLTTPL